MTEWFQQHDVLLIWLGFISVVTMLGSLMLVGWFLIRIPADYFSNRNQKPPLHRSRPMWLQYMVTILKNLLGIVFILAGLAMLVLPGQGLLTMLIGLLLLDVPGKRRLQLWVIRRKSMLRSINAIRRKAKKPPLIFPVA